MFVLKNTNEKEKLALYLNESGERKKTATNDNKISSSFRTAQCLTKRKVCKSDCPGFRSTAFSTWPRYLVSSSPLQKMPYCKTPIPPAANKSNSHVAFHPSPPCNWSGSPSQPPLLLVGPHCEEKSQTSQGLKGSKTVLCYQQLHG